MLDLQPRAMECTKRIRDAGRRTTAFFNDDLLEIWKCLKTFCRTDMYCNEPNLISDFIKVTISEDQDLVDYSKDFQSRLEDLQERGLASVQYSGDRLRVPRSSAGNVVRVGDDF
jgi:hypothetical protein